MPTTTDPSTAGAKALRSLRPKVIAAALGVIDQPTQDVGEAAARVALIGQLQGHLAVAMKDAKNQLIALTDTGKRTVEVGRSTLLIERTRPLKRDNWQHPEIAAKLIDAAHQAGQLKGPADVGPLILEMANITYWRGDKRNGSGLYRLGIDRDEYCTAEPEQAVTVTGEVK